VDGEDKSKFYIFDLCRNFEFFRMNKGKATANQMALQSAIFYLKAQIVYKLQDLAYQTQELIPFREKLVEEMLAKVQAAAEEMTMRRYVHMPPEGRPCCPEGCLAALLGELNQIQDHQNQILAELLRALERMADALERR